MLERHLEKRRGLVSVNRLAGLLTVNLPSLLRSDLNYDRRS